MIIRSVHRSKYWIVILLITLVFSCNGHEPPPITLLLLLHESDLTDLNAYITAYVIPNLLMRAKWSRSNMTNLETAVAVKTKDACSYLVLPTTSLKDLTPTEQVAPVELPKRGLVVPLGIHTAPNIADCLPTAHHLHEEVLSLEHPILLGHAFRSFGLTRELQTRLQHAFEHNRTTFTADDPPTADPEEGFTVEATSGGGADDTTEELEVIHSQVEGHTGRRGVIAAIVVGSIGTMLVVAYACWQLTKKGNNNQSSEALPEKYIIIPKNELPSLVILTRSGNNCWSPVETKPSTNLIPMPSPRRQVSIDKELPADLAAELFK